MTIGFESGLRDTDSNKYVGDSKQWDHAENAPRKAAQNLEVDFTEEQGEAAFYGPKIDFVVKDVIEREWQLGTVQVDYNLPERFDLSYIGADNEKHRPCYDSPCAFWIYGALLWRTYRTLRWKLSHLAGSRASSHSTYER